MRRVVLSIVAFIILCAAPDPVAAQGISCSDPGYGVVGGQPPNVGTTYIRSAELSAPLMQIDTWRIEAIFPISTATRDLTYQFTLNRGGFLFRNPAEVVFPGSIERSEYRCSLDASFFFFGGDQRIDKEFDYLLFWQHRDSGQLAAWKMVGPNLVGAPAISPAQDADPDWRIVASGDFNGDKEADLLWQHRVTRALVVWFMQAPRR